MTAKQTDPQAASVKDEDFEASLLTVGEEKKVTAEGIFGEGVSDEAEEAVEAFAHVDGVGGGEDAGSGGEAEHDPPDEGGGRRAGRRCVCRSRCFGSA